jgi:hypothetical protein
MFCLNYKAEALAGFHTCAIRSRSNRSLHHRRNSICYSMSEIGSSSSGSLPIPENPARFAGRLVPNDQCNLFHLCARRQSSVQIVGAIADPERHFVQWTKRTEDELFALAESFIIPVAGFEPATSGVSGEVTVVFTTGRDHVLHGRDARASCVDSPGNQREEPTRGTISPGTL